MNTQEFVDAIRLAVVDTTASGVSTVMRHPPGAAPDGELVEMSRWYNGLSDDDVAMVERAMGIAVRHAVFGVFAVLDGARKVDPSWAPGDHFELHHIHGGRTEIIGGDEGPPLHELL